MREFHFFSYVPITYSLLTPACTVRAVQACDNAHACHRIWIDSEWLYN